VQAAATVSTDLRGGGMSRALRWAAAARSAARRLHLPTNVTVIVGGGALSTVCNLWTVLCYTWSPSDMVRSI